MSLGRSRGPSPIPVSDETDVVTVEPLSKGTVGHVLSMLPLGDWGLLTGTKVDPVVWVLPMTYMLWRLKSACLSMCSYQGEMLHHRWFGVWIFESWMPCVYNVNVLYGPHICGAC